MAYCVFCNEAGALPVVEGDANATGICVPCLKQLKRLMQEQ